MTTTNCNNSFNPNDLEPKICDSDKWLVILEAVFIAIVIVGSLVANFIVLFLVAKYKALRYMSMLVSVCGVFVDLLMTLFFHIPALVSVSYGGWPFGDIGCQVIGAICYYLILVRWMVMAIVALDRFSYILFPLSYHGWSKPYTIILVISAWCVPLFMSIPSIVQIGNYSYRTGLSTCALDCMDDNICKVIHLLVFLIMYSIGVLVPACLYTAIAVIARCKRHHIKMGLQLTENGENGGMNRHRQNDVRWTKTDTKGLLGIVLVFVCLIITNTPVYVLILMRRSAPEAYHALPLWGHMFMANLFFLSNTINPLLTLRNKDFSKTLFKQCCKRKPRAYRTSSLTTLRRTSISQTTAAQ